MLRSAQIPCRWSRGYQARGSRRLRSIDLCGGAAAVCRVYRRTRDSFFFVERIEKDTMRIDRGTPRRWRSSRRIRRRNPVAGGHGDGDYDDLRLLFCGEWGGTYCAKCGQRSEEGRGEIAHAGGDGSGPRVASCFSCSRRFAAPQRLRKGLARTQSKKTTAATWAHGEMKTRLSDLRQSRIQSAVSEGQGWSFICFFCILGIAS